jgi:hypothetical protein
MFNSYFSSHVPIETLNNHEMNLCFFVSIDVLIIIVVKQFHLFIENNINKQQDTEKYRRMIYEKTQTSFYVINVLVSLFFDYLIVEFDSYRMNYHRRTRHLYLHRLSMNYWQR